MFFLESAEIGIGKEKLFDILCELLEKNNIVYNKDELELAYQEACAAYVGVTRYFGEEYVTHTLNVAIILAQLEADINSIIAGMFCDVYRKGVISLDGLNDGLNSSVMRLITDLQTQDVENASDEILLIKLPESLEMKN